MMLETISTLTSDLPNDAQTFSIVRSKLVKSERGPTFAYSPKILFKLLFQEGGRSNRVIRAENHSKLLPSLANKQLPV